MLAIQKYKKMTTLLGGKLTIVPVHIAAHAYLTLDRQRGMHITPDNTCTHPNTMKVIPRLRRTELEAWQSIIKVVIWQTFYKYHDDMLKTGGKCHCNKMYFCWHRTDGVMVVYIANPGSSCNNCSVRF